MRGLGGILGSAGLEAGSGSHEMPCADIRGIGSQMDWWLRISSSWMVLMVEALRGVGYA